MISLFVKTKYEVMRVEDMLEINKLLLKSCYEKAVNLGRAKYINSNGSFSLGDVFRMDFLKFLVFIAVSDKKIMFQFLHNNTAVSC